jgi:hypothetical protein
VFFGLLGRFAPTEVRVKNPSVCQGCDGCEPGRCVDCYECFRRAAPEERELNLRPPAIGLGLPERALPGGAAFVIVVLAVVTFDGLLQTPLWLEIVRVTPVTQTSGVILLPLLFFGIYLGFVELSRIFGGEGRRDLGSSRPPTRSPSCPSPSPTRWPATTRTCSSRGR